VLMLLVISERGDSWGSHISKREGERMTSKEKERENLSVVVTKANNWRERTKLFG